MPDLMDREVNPLSCWVCAAIACAVTVIVLLPLALWWAGR